MQTNLKRLCTDKTLDKLFTQVFCPQFAQQGLQSLTLNITDDEYKKCSENLKEFAVGTADRETEIQSILKQDRLPLELLEMVLMKTFVLKFIECYRSHESIRLTFSTLGAVCYNWWQTMKGWPQSTTRHWFRHKLGRVLNYVCQPFALFHRLQCSLSVSSSVRGVVQCDSKLFVVCESSDSIFVFGPNREQLPKIRVKQLKEAQDIVACMETRLLYVSDWPRDSRCVWRVSSDGLQIEKWLPNRTTTTSQFRPWTLSATSRRLLVTSLDNSELSLYGSDGVELKRLVLSQILRPQHAVETSHGTFIISHIEPQPQVSEVDASARIIRVFRDSQQLDEPRYLAPDSDGRVFVTDYYKHRVLLLNSRLELERVLLDTQQSLADCPRRLCYTEQTGQLFVACLNVNCIQLFVVRTQPTKRQPVV